MKQLSLQEINAALAIVLPPGFRVLAQYRISADDVAIRIVSPDRKKHIDLEPIQTFNLYESLDDFTEFMRPSVEKALQSLTSNEAHS